MKRFLLARCGNASFAGFEIVADIYRRNNWNRCNM